MVSAAPAVAPKLDLIRNLLSVFPEIPGTHRPPEKEKNEGGEPQQEQTKMQTTKEEPSLGTPDHVEGDHAELEAPGTSARPQEVPSPDSSPSTTSLLDDQGAPIRVVSAGQRGADTGPSLKKAPQTSLPPETSLKTPVRRTTADFTRDGLLTPEAIATALRSFSLDDEEAAAEEGAEEPCEPSALGLVYDAVMELHVCQTGDHYECPQRTSALVKLLTKLGLQERCTAIVPRAATDAELRLVHTSAHIDAMDSGDKYPDPDIYISPGSALAARTAAGCCIEAVDAVLSGRCRASFAVVRPPGHHAECQRAMGFCMYNNTAIAALVARQRCSGRVVLFDWDVHHGNGIQNVLYNDPDIMYISMHRGAGFYPGTGEVKEVGEGAAAGRNINIPWPRGGFGDADYMATFELVVEPIVADFRPDIIIVSAGFDAAEGDPLGGMSLSPAGYAHMTRRLQKLSKDGRIVLALEGGYNIGVTAACAAACVKTLLGEEPPELTGRGASRPRRETHDVLAAVTAAHASYWPDALPTKFLTAWEDYCLAQNFKRDVRISRK